MCSQIPQKKTTAMTIVSDYHMHTPLCGHAVGEPEAYAEAACRAGLDEIGFSDHAPLVARRIPDVAMREDQLPEYHDLIAETGRRFSGRLIIKTGLEADFVPGYESRTKAIIEAFPYDFVIGSVHFIEGWAFDHPDERDAWSQKDVDVVYREYYRLLRESARSGLFDIMGHVDLVKKFGHRAEADLTSEIRETAEIFRSCGVAVEINTAGLRKPVGEIYPALGPLRIYREAGVPLTFGSDAHRPEDVGRDFDRALDLAREAGYKEYVTFRRRRIERIIRL